MSSSVAMSHYLVTAELDTPVPLLKDFWVYTKIGHYHLNLNSCSRILKLEESNM